MMKFFLLRNVKMPTIVGILTFISGKNSEVMTFFMFNSTEHDEFFLHRNVKMPTIVGILTFISGKNSILGLSEPKNADFLDIYILMSI